MDYVVLDTEFLSYDLRPTGLVSIALVSEHASYYAVNAAMAVRDLHRGSSAEFMKAHVWPHLPARGPYLLDYDHEDVKDYGTIRNEVDAFLKGACPTGNAKEDIELVVNCGAQDMIRLHTLLCNNDWSKMGSWVPKASDDMYRIKRSLCRAGHDLSGLPEQDPDTQHHALYDAMHELEVITLLRQKYGNL